MPDQFIAKPQKNKHPSIHRHDYLPGWELSESIDGDEARLLFKKISSHLSHLSWKRARVVEPDETARWAYDLPFFMVKLFEEFLAEVEKENGGKPGFTLLKEGIQDARRNLPAVPPAGGATTTGAFTVPNATELPPRTTGPD